MTKRLLIDARQSEETRVVQLSGTRIEDFDYETDNRKQLKGNVYLARVTRVEILISYWIIALPAGFVMTYGIIGPKLGAAGMWIGMILGLSVFCLLGILRLKKVVGANLKTSVTL